jgi:digeranylgeranylglycerophospholipid reductase
MYDVVVIGGGPVGSYTAYRLADTGHSVAVAERKPPAGEKVCCTGIISQECADIFNIDEKTIFRRVNSATLFSPSGNRLELRREEPQACILDRAAFDRSMAERAQAAGAEYLYQSRVTGVTIENDRAVATLFRDGKESKITAKCVIIASGFTPGLIGRLGLGAFRDYTVGVQTEAEARDVSEVEVYFGDVAPGFFGWMVPTTSTTVRVGLMAREKPGHHLRKWLERLAAEGRIATADYDICYGGIPLRPLTRTCGERLVAVGDAAGQVKPTTGGGIYYGLLGADTAAATLHRALEEGDLSAKRLARYQRGWRKKLGRELTTGYWARRLFERLNNRQIDRLFEIVKAGGIDEALLKSEDISFDWHSRTIASLLKYRAVAGTLHVLKIPFKTRED